MLIGKLLECSDIVLATNDVKVYYPALPLGNGNIVLKKHVQFSKTRIHDDVHSTIHTLDRGPLQWDGVNLELLPD